jgi:hypothetical protein
VTAILIAVFINYTIELSLGCDMMIDNMGHTPDLMTHFTSKGLCLVASINIVIFLDIKTHTYFFQVFVVLTMTIFPTSAFYLF